MFLEGLGASPSVIKGTEDFATEVDIAIEEELRRELTSRTGIPVFGEEQGGDAGRDLLWIVDPIDGTANYAARNPMCSILVGLVEDGQPIVAVTAIPFLRRRLSAYVGSGLFIDGERVVPKARDFDLQVGISTISAGMGGIADTPLRHGVLTGLADSSMRPRVTGSVGVDLAFAAQGIFTGAISFSPNPWDNAAGVLLAREAGLRVTDALGEPWSVDAEGVVAGSPDCHSLMMRVIEDSRPGFVRPDSHSTE